MAKKLFGTDGVRGKANTYPMVPDFALKLGLACAELVCVNKKKVAIAKDTRISGDMLEAAMIAGFASKGIDVIRLGVLPTPVLTTFVADLNVDMGVMITASHNPYYDNGIKLIDAKGGKFADEVSRKLEEMIEEDNFCDGTDVIGRVWEDCGLLEKYVEKIGPLKTSAKPLEGIRLVLDCANGAFYKTAPKVVRSFGAEVIEIGVEPDGYNINRDCGSTCVGTLQKAVIENGADIGIAFDGDGDRIIVCDENGNKEDGDQIIACLARSLHEKGQLKGNAIVATIVSNAGLAKFARSMGLEYYKTSVGERYVIDKMKEIGANVGGEESGHMVLSDYSKSGDGLVAALIVLMDLAERKQKMSEIFPIFEPMPKIRVDIKFEDKEVIAKVMADEKVKVIVAKCEKEVEGKGQILVRASGTEPKLQVWVWCEDEALLSRTSQAMVEEISRFGGVPKQVL